MLHDARSAILTIPLLLSFACKDASEAVQAVTAPDGCAELQQAFTKWKAEDDAFTQRLENEKDPQRVMALLEESVVKMEKRIAEGDAIEVADPELQRLVDRSVDLARPTIPMLRSTVTNIRGGHLSSLVEQLDVLQAQVAKSAAVDEEIKTYCGAKP